MVKTVTIQLITNNVVGSADDIDGGGVRLPVAGHDADDIDGGGVRLPVAGHDEDGARRLRAGEAGWHSRLEEVARQQRVVDGERGRAVGDVERVYGTRCRHCWPARQG